MEAAVLAACAGDARRSEVAVADRRLCGIVPNVKKSAPKLIVRRETLRRLRDADLSHVVGGLSGDRETCVANAAPLPSPPTQLCG